jgi:hypothetical protein
VVLVVVVDERTFSHSLASDSSTSSASRLSTGASSFASFEAIVARLVWSQYQDSRGSSLGFKAVYYVQVLALFGHWWC